MTLPFPTFPDDDGYKSPIFLYLAYHGKNEMQQTNMDLEDQYAFGEDPGLLENLEIGEELLLISTTTDFSIELFEKLSVLLPAMLGVLTVG